MRRRTIAYQQELARAAKLSESKVESAQRRVCPTCGAALGRDRALPVEGINGDSRSNRRKNTRGHQSRD